MKEKEKIYQFPIFIVILIAILTSILALMIFIAIGGFTPCPDPAPRVLKVEVDINSSNDTLVVILNQKWVDWSDYKVVIDEVELSTPAEESIEGDKVYFSNEDWNPDVGMTYNVIFVHIGDNAIWWERYIKAK